MSEQSNWKIKKAVVVGAGAMGSGIAAHLANAGVRVYLLDIVPKDASDRNIIAKSAIERMLKATPSTDPLSAGFMIPENAQLITPGNTEDHLEEAVSDADWVVEVVIEDLQIKRDLYAKLDALKKPGMIISSNTSTIPLQDLVEGRSDAFKQHFLITHFFNPPRFMRLLEIVGGPETKPDVLETIREFGEIALGKNVILCKDTPAFIANRIGIYFMFRTIVEAMERGIKIEEVDAVLGRPMGYPKDGVFGLLDLVGIGIIPHVAESLLKTLPDDDPFRTLDQKMALGLIHQLLADGRTGRKSPKGGFYRMEKRADGSRQKQAMDLKTGEYHDADRPRLDCLRAAKKQGPRAVFESQEAVGPFAWIVMRDTLLYAARLVPEISNDIADVDAAMRDGYNHQWGPFELLDQIGVSWFCERLRQEGIELPPLLRMADNRPFYQVQDGVLRRLVFNFENHKAAYVELPTQPGVIQLSAIKRKSKPLVTHYSASLWDIGDGVTCLEFHSKMNTLDPSILWVVNQSIQLIQQSRGKYRAMVIYNEAKNFSLGANLGLIQAGFLAAKNSVAKSIGLSGPMELATYKLVEALVYQGQSIFAALRNAPFPVIGAPNGMALGGGCEILLHCDAIQANAEIYMGLVESGVGVIPGWGGCVRYLDRCQNAVDVHGPIKDGAMPKVVTAFQAIMMPQFSVSTSAQDARKKRWLRESDGITMNPSRLLADAKAKALELAKNYQPPEPTFFQLPGVSGKMALHMAIDDFYTKGDATWHDVVVADALAETLTGGETHVGVLKTESEIAQLERENFLSLIQTRQTQKRIAHTLKTGKPLREEPLEEAKPVEEIRKTRKKMKIKPRELSGQPLVGKDASQLRLMADVTAIILKQVVG